MRFVRYDGDQLGLSADVTGVIDLTDRFDLHGRGPVEEYRRWHLTASEYADVTKGGQA